MVRVRLGRVVLERRPDVGAAPRGADTDRVDPFEARVVDGELVVTRYSDVGSYVLGGAEPAQVAEADVAEATDDPYADVSNYFR